ncbi:MAG: DUF4397 domain-containing protein [Sphingobacterium sp.]|jgi:hypothetical protein|nr:DUF4397 domain-containing protein [Sphingobacterium sp.]
MKKNPSIYPFMLMMIAFIACNKNPEPELNASLTLVNAVSDQDSLLPVFDSAAFESAARLKGNILQYRNYVPANHLTVLAKTHTVLFYPFTAQKKETPITTVNFQATANDAHTIIVLGTKANPDHILLNGLPPFHERSDSTFGIRFVNAAPDKKGIRIQITSAGTQQNPIDLTFKEKSSYLTVSALSEVSDMTISVLDQATGALIKQYTLVNENDPGTDRNRWRYKNFTFVWLPKNKNGTWADSPFLIQDF